MPTTSVSARESALDRRIADALAIKGDVSRKHFERHWHAIQRGLERTPCSAREIEAFPHHPHAVGVGYKITMGKATRRPCVRFYVHRKLPGSMLSPSNHIPGSLDGIPTDVIEAPPARLAVSCTFARRLPCRPIQGGISVANSSNLAGTLGIVCRSTRAGEEAQRFILSNRHVLCADSDGQVSVIQPGPADGGQMTSQVGTFARSAPIQEGAHASNVIDAAAALLDATIEFTPTICTLGAPRGTVSPALNQKVHKHGRTTGYTSGVVHDPSVDFMLSLSRTQTGRIARFTQQIRLAPNGPNALFAQDGDSGSLVLTKPDNDIVGLLFACPDNGTYAYANPIDIVFRELELDLIAT